AGRRVYQATSPQLAASPILRGRQSAISPREALILISLLNHPWLLHDHLEEVAVLEFTHQDAQKLRDMIVATVVGQEPARNAEVEATRLRHLLAEKGLAPLVERIEQAVTAPAVWGAQPEAAAEDVLATWHQLIVLHRQRHALLKELKDAERALGEAVSEANCAWLNDVKGRLAQTEGLEALIEGFGEASGRFQRNV
ncbi:MAG: DNA primase, partial [Xanthobacteraceae bacterium]